VQLTTNRLIQYALAVTVLVFAVALPAGAGTVKNGLIAITGGPESGQVCQNQICVVSPTGTGLKVLTSQATLAAVDPGGCQLCSGVAPSFSRDGKRIAFQMAGSKDGSVQIHELWVMNADGTHLKSLTSPTAFNGINNPTWSPDGTTIYFAAGQPNSDSLDIWSIRANGTGLHRLTDPDVTPFAADPTVSPNGTQIAFVSYEGTDANGDPNPSGIYVMATSGANPHRLTAPSTDFQQAPAWTPDGKSLLFTQLAPDWATSNISHIYTMKSDGTGIRELTAGGFWDDDPIVSPDGTSVTFSRYRGKIPHRHVYVMNINGSHIRELHTPEGMPTSWARASS
jgi:Tol biopolymer transport system component